MSKHPIGPETARTLRGLWFDYLDTLEPVRPLLHRYCLRLTGSIWDAEDLVQDTLLRGFGVIGRGDLHGESSAFGNPRAWLCQVATNLWIDRVRRSGREVLQQEVEASDSVEQGQVVTKATGAALFERASPQERAALVLKEVFDFSLDEIAEVLCTTSGTVKTALHRVRGKLEERHVPVPHRSKAASPELIARFIAAFNARDVAAVTSLLLETNAYEVQGVGGERGTKTSWLNVSFREGVDAEHHTIHGEGIIAYTFLHKAKKYLAGIARMEEVEGKISRILNYYFCVDTLAFVASELGLEPWSNGYHQTGDTLAGMVADSQLPWR